MNNQPRLILFFLMSFVILFGSQLVMERMGIIKPPAPKAKAKPAESNDPAKPKPEDDATDSKPKSDQPGGEAQTKPETETGETKPAQLEAPRAAATELIGPGLLVLGDPNPKAPAAAGEPELLETPSRIGEPVPPTDDYRLRIGFDQRGGGIAWIESTYIEAERAKKAPPSRLTFLRRDPVDPASYTLGFARPKPDGGRPDPIDVVPDLRP